MEAAKTKYIKDLSAWDRKDLLRVCRAAGLTAHKLLTNDQLAEALWENVAKFKMGA